MRREAHGEYETMAFVIAHFEDPKEILDIFKSSFGWSFQGNLDMRTKGSRTITSKPFSSIMKSSAMQRRQDSKEETCDDASDASEFIRFVREDLLFDFLMQDV